MRGFLFWLSFKILVWLQCLGGQIVAVQPYRQSPANYVEAVSTI